jgi:hypothetical protein
MVKMVNYYLETYKLKDSYIKDAIEKLDCLHEINIMYVVLMILKV